MRGLGEEAEAVGPDRRAELEADQHAGRDHRDERRPPLWAHAPSIGPTRRARLRRALPTTPLGEGEVSVRRPYDVAMSPWKRSCSSVPAPCPLSDQWCLIRPCLGALYSKSNAQARESVKHENVAFGPKNVAMKTSVKPQSAGHVAFGSKVPPVTLPRRKPWKRPCLPASTAVPCRPRVSQAPGLWPSLVRNVPRSRRSSV